MEKLNLNIIKKLSTLVKTSSVEIIKHALVENNRLKATNLDGVIVIIDNIDLPDGMYLLSDLAKGKLLRKTKLDNSKFPVINEEFESESSFTTKNDFKSFLKFVSNDGLQQALNCIYVTEQGKCATDSHSMRFTTKEMSDENILVHSNVANILTLLSSELELHKEKDILKVVDGDVTIFGTIPQYNFPNFPLVIPNTEKETIITKNCKDVIKKLSSFKYKRVYFVDDNTYVASNVDEKMKDVDLIVDTKKDISIDFDCDVAFNIEYLKVITNDIDSEITIGYINSKLPVVFNDEYLLMPLRTKDIDTNNCDELILK